MKKKYEKYDEIYDGSLRKHIERYYKDSYRRGWYISDVVKIGSLNNKWLIKWERKPI